MKKLHFIFVLLLPQLMFAGTDRMVDPAEMARYMVPDSSNKRNSPYNGELELGCLHLLPQGTIINHIPALNGASFCFVKRVKRSPLNVGLLCESALRTEHYKEYPFNQPNYSINNWLAKTSYSMTHFDVYSKLYLCNPDRWRVKPFIDCAFGLMFFREQLSYSPDFSRNTPGFTNTKTSGMSFSAYAGGGLSIDLPFGNGYKMSLNSSVGILYGGASRYYAVSNLETAYKSGLNFLQCKIGVSFFGIIK